MGATAGASRLMGLDAHQTRMALGIAADDIVRVEHYSPNVPGAGSLQRREVHNGLEGKFCLEYNIAAAFIDNIYRGNL